MNDGSSGAGRAAREVEQRYGRDDDLALRGFAPLLGAFAASTAAATFAAWRSRIREAFRPRILRLRRGRSTMTIPDPTPRPPNPLPDPGRPDPVPEPGIPDPTPRPPGPAEPQPEPLP